MVWARRPPALSGSSKRTREAIENALLAAEAPPKRPPGRHVHHARTRSAGALVKDGVDPVHGSAMARPPVRTGVRYPKLPLECCHGGYPRDPRLQHRREALVQEHSLRHVFDLMEHMRDFPTAAAVHRRVHGGPELFDPGLVALHVVAHIIPLDRHAMRLPLLEHLVE